MWVFNTQFCNTNKLDKIKVTAMAKMIFENNVWHLSNNWDIDDVRSAIDYNDIEEAKNFTDLDCVAVLELAANAFDANIGINWSVIEAAIKTISQTK